MDAKKEQHQKIGGSSGMVTLQNDFVNGENCKCWHAEMNRKEKQVILTKKRNLLYLGHIIREEKYQTAKNDKEKVHRKNYLDNWYQKYK